MGWEMKFRNPDIHLHGLEMLRIVARKSSAAFQEINTPLTDDIIASLGQSYPAILRCGKKGKIGIQIAGNSRYNGMPSSHDHRFTIGAHSRRTIPKAGVFKH
jgi:hypothetical protein